MKNVMKEMLNNLHYNSVCYAILDLSDQSWERYFTLEDPDEIETESEKRFSEIELPAM